MDFLPLFHKLQDRLVLVVGGGEVAVRKARLLSDAGATLRVVAPEIRDELREMASARHGEVLLRDYQSADLHGVALIIAATDDEPGPGHSGQCGGCAETVQRDFPRHC